MVIQSSVGSTSVGVQTTQKTLKKTNSELHKILAQLSSGNRINQAGDDAAGLAVSEQVRTQIRGFKVATQNVEDAMAALNIADGAGREVSDLLQRQRGLATAAQNGTLNDNDRKAIDTEYQALSSEVGRIAGSTQYNKQNLTGGQDIGTGIIQIQAGPNAGDQIAMPQVDFDSISKNIGATSLQSSDEASKALSAIDDALDSLNTQRTSVGASINKLGSSMNNLSVAMANTQAAESVIRDEDMAKGLAELTRARLLQEGSIQAFDRFNEISQNHILGLFEQ